MSKGIGICCADIYLEFPEIMEEEFSELCNFLDDEHIRYTGATKRFKEKDKEIERLNNIINELEKSIIFKLTEFKRNKDYFIDEKDIEQLYEELKELKESGNNE